MLFFESVLVICILFNIFMLFSFFPGYSESTEEFEQLLSCSPLSSRNPNCHVSCSLGWNYDGSDQWVCGDTYRQWLISFFVFLGVHTVGTVRTFGILFFSILSFKWLEELPLKYQTDHLLTGHGWQYNMYIAWLEPSSGILALGSCLLKCSHK